MKMNYNKLVYLSVLALIFVLITTETNAQQPPPMVEPIYEENGVFLNSSDTTCNLNVNCLPHCFRHRNATILILFTKVIPNPLEPGKFTQKMRVGTGVLLNQNLPDGVPRKNYVLTAGHFLDSHPGDTFDYNFNDVFFVFNHQSKYCNVNGLPMGYKKQYLKGAKLIKSPLNHSKAQNDWALLEIVPSIPSEFGACYAGWDTYYTENEDEPEETPKLPSVSNIHHPSGDLKKYNYSDNSNDLSVLYIEQGNPVHGEAYYASWSTGKSELGSSGSPIFEYDCFGFVIGIAVKATNDIGFCDIPNRHSICTRMGTVLFENQGILDPINQGFAFWLCDTTVATCFDNIENQNETGIDCGGVCPPCMPPNTVGDTLPPPPCQALINEFEISSYCYGGAEPPTITFLVNSNCDYNLYWTLGSDPTALPYLVTDEIFGTSDSPNISKYESHFDFGGNPPPLPFTGTFTLHINHFTFGDIAVASFPLTLYDTPSAYAGEDFSMCLGNTDVLGGQPTASGGNGSYTYLWSGQPVSGQTFLSNANIANPTITPTITGTWTYTVTAYDYKGCSATDTVVVIVDTVSSPAVRAVCGEFSGAHPTFRAARIVAGSVCPAPGETVVHSGATVEFLGSDEVTLLPGFTATAGGHFTARIAPCPGETLPPTDTVFTAPEPRTESPQLLTTQQAAKPTLTAQPNPFRDEVTLRFTLPEDENITLIVYNALGLPIVTATNNAYKKGTHSLLLDTTNWAKGAYSAVLRTSSGNLVAARIIRI